MPKPEFRPTTETHERISRRVILIGGIILFLGLASWQVLNIFKPRENPPVVQEPICRGPETRRLAERACFDCHSNETDWPWYTPIIFMEPMLVQDVEKGREVLNYSEWEEGCCTEEEIQRMAEIVGKEQMPPAYYRILHPEAVLTESERGQLVNGLIETMRSGDD